MRTRYRPVRLNETDKVLEKIFSMCVRKESGCLVWKRTTDEEGYGVVSIGGLHYLAHRLVAAIKQDRLEILDMPKLLVCHSCDNPPCCEPDHLVIADHSFNLKDSHSKGRRSGVVQPKQRALTDTQLDLALKIYIRTSSYSETGRTLGITPSAVWRAVNIYRKEVVVRDKI